jgi:hypothetical protein
MRRNALDKLRDELASLRRATVDARALESLAKRLGRKLVKRGKHPMWESKEFADLFPLSIPHHGGKDIPSGTKRSILDQLEEDVLAWEEVLNDQEAKDSFDEDDDDPR